MPLLNRGKTLVCLFAGGNDEKLVSACCTKLKSSSRFVPAKLDAHSAFLIKHSIGTIKYNAQGFVFKNKDVLKPEMVDVVQVRTIMLLSSSGESACRGPKRPDVDVVQLCELRLVEPIAKEC